MKRLLLATALLVACGEGRNEPRRGDPAAAALEVAPSPPPTPPAPTTLSGEHERSATPEVDRPYDESADAEQDLAAAVRRASSNGKRVLVIFGGNWCKWCRRLEHVLRNDAYVRASLDRGYEVVHVDTGARRSGKNAGIAQRYGDVLRHGLPVIVVLDGRGSLVHVQETGSLEVGERHDPAKIVAFLERR